ncbi:MAG: trypsin-like serine protease [Deltaproteobacteria bacterium]|nr:trypsin-like serine protease [Deltaproteobacteria bacterium]
MRKLQLMVVSAVIISLLLGGCGGGGGSDSNACGDLNLRVSNGDSCRVGQTPVVLILAATSDGNIASCTGTFVTLDDVLTAAHCIPPNLVDLAVITERDGFYASRGEILNAAIHPQYVNVTSENGSFAVFDFAMITVSRPVDVSPVPLLVSDALVVSEKITVFGYGKDEAGRGVLERDGDDLLRAGFMQLSDVREGIFRADFDLTGSSICQGDSGGPAVQVVGGTSSLVGVTSLISAIGCTEGSRAFFGNVQYPPVYEWITSYAPDVAIR